MRCRIRFLSMLLMSLTLGVSYLLGLDAAHAHEEEIRMAAKTPSLYDFTMTDIDGKLVSLGRYKGTILLIVNTASFCGNTPQYADLQELYENYHEKGLEILAFPANNFGQQDPGTNEDIKGFCLTKYSVSFPLFSKVSVKGKDKHPCTAI